MPLHTIMTAANTVSRVSSDVSRFAGSRRSAPLRSRLRPRQEPACRRALQPSVGQTQAHQGTNLSRNIPTRCSRVECKPSCAVNLYPARIGKAADATEVVRAEYREDPRWMSQQPRHRDRGLVDALLL